MEGISRVDPGGYSSRTSQPRQQSLLATRYLAFRKVNDGRDHTGSRKGKFHPMEIPQIQAELPVESNGDGPVQQRRRMNQ